MTRQAILEEYGLPTDLRSLRYQLTHAEEAQKASEEETRRKIHRVKFLEEMVQVREWQEEPPKRDAIAKLVDEVLKPPQAICLADQRTAAQAVKDLLASE